jgi:hypothetical protein
MTKNRNTTTPSATRTHKSGISQFPHKTTDGVEIKCHVYADFIGVRIGYPALNVGCLLQVLGWAIEVVSLEGIKKE